MKLRERIKAIWHSPEHLIEVEDECNNHHLDALRAISESTDGLLDERELDERFGKLEDADEEADKAFDTMDDEIKEAFDTTHNEIKDLDDRVRSLEESQLEQVRLLTIVVKEMRVKFEILTEMLNEGNGGAIRHVPGPFMGTIGPDGNPSGGER